MALADIVLEGLTLILVIALGAVLIGGLSYLTTTTASANNARLITAGTYVYLAGPTYINGTLYVPMYNIGEYTVEVKYLFVEGLNGVQEYATNIILKPGRYYVYELSIDYTPKAVTIVVSPTRDPKLALEFNSNVSTPGPIALTPMSQGSSGGGLIAVSVVDPYNAGWTVSWSYSGQSYSLSKSTSYTWFINPPYVPIQISFKASITKNPPGLTCQIVPASVSKTYSAGSVQEFTVICPITVVVNDPYNAGWQISWSGAASGSKSGSSSAEFEVITTSVNGSVTFTASIPSPFSSICSIAPTNATAYPGQTVTFTVSCTRPPYFVYVTVTGDSCGIGWTIYSSVSSISGTGNVKNAMLAIGGYTDWLQVVIWKAPNGQWDFEPGGLRVTNGSSVTFTATCPSSSNNNNYVYITVTGDTCGADWQITSSNGGVLTGTSDVSNDPLYIDGNPSVTLDASILVGNATISPTSTTAKPGQSVTFTVSCQGQQPPSGGSGNNYYVYVTVTNDTLGAGWQVSSSVKSISGSGNVNNEQLPIGGQTDTLTASITSNPSGYTCTINPSSEQVTSGNSYTFTVSCVQSSQPQPPSNYFCIVNPSASDNVGGGSGASVSPSSTQYIPPGQSVLFTWAIQNNPVQYNGQTYYFNNWVVTLNGKTVVNEQYSGVSYNFQCPSNLSSNQTYTLSGTAYYWQRYLQVGGGTTFNVPSNGTFPINSRYTTAYFTWSDPLFQSGSWNIQYQAFGTSFTISVQLNDYYSESGQAPQLQASTTLNIQGPTGYTCWIDGISPTSGSITSAQASNWLPTSAQVSIGCASQSSNPGPPL